MKRRHSLKALVLLLALGMAPVHAAESAGAFIRAKHEEMVQRVHLARNSADERKLERAFDELLDYESLARESLKDSWDERTPEERAQFQQILTELVRTAYRRNLKRIGAYRVEYRGEEQGPRGHIVRTLARNPENPREEPVSIDYVVREGNGGFRVVDIVTEGSSLVSNYRSQFRRIVKNEGFSELIRRMQSRLDRSDSE